MATDPSKKTSPHERRDPSQAPLTADEIEQRQSFSGTPEEELGMATRTEQPASADVYEQRQEADGAGDDRSSEDAADGPLTADMIEQRRAVDDVDHAEDGREE